MPRGRPRSKSDDVLFRSAEVIGWALGGLEREILATRERLSALTEQAATLRARLGKRAARGAAATTTPDVETIPRRKRRRMSAEARKRISEMMKKRWAERKRARKGS